MTLFLKLWGLAKQHWPLLLAAGIGASAAWMLKPSPPQALQEEVKVTEAAFGREDLTRKTEEGPWTLKTWEFGPPLAAAAADRTGSRSTPPANPGSPSPDLRRSPDASRVHSIDRMSPAAPCSCASTPADPGRPLLSPCSDSNLLRYSEESHGPTASETHSERESAQSTTQTLKLSQTGSSAPQWALSVGFENVLHEKALRLSVRRKFLGPIWLEASAVPSSMAVGFGAAIEF